VPLTTVESIPTTVHPDIAVEPAPKFVNDPTGTEGDSKEPFRINSALQWEMIVQRRKIASKMRDMFLFNLSYVQDDELSILLGRTVDNVTFGT
jgi:hypothetical protein